MEKGYTDECVRISKELIVKEERLNINEKQLKRLLNMSKWTKEDLEFYKQFFGNIVNE